MRRLVVVALAVALALTLTGCGGGEEPVEPTPEAAPAAAPAADPNAEEEEPDTSPPEEQVYEPFPTDPEVVPLEILDRIEDGQPMMLYIFDSDQSTTLQQDEWVREVTTDYPGLIDELSYDIGKYVTTDENGAITVDEKALTESEDDSPALMNAQKIARLMGDEWLDVTYTPFFFFIDSDGYITYRIRGPVDSKTLEGQVLRATD